MLQQGVLHWSDAMTFGSICQESRELYKEHEDLSLSPLLLSLEGMVGSNIHSYCGKVFVLQSQRVCVPALPF